MISMIILAIDTSCDETSVAILKAGGKKWPHFEILSNIVSSQVKIHRKYGGVYPFLAKREHQKNLPIVFKKAIKEAKNPRIDLIAVTVGPGLEPCLWTGINLAKNLARKLKLQIIPVNHIEAHIFANLLPQIRSKSKIKNQKSKIINFPAICLVVSGGHTQLVLMKNFGEYKILGETRDDAAGECFDKVARILGLGYPGGPAIALEAAESKKKSFGKIPTIVDFLPKLPRPMIYQKNYDFSFSGLKTAVLYHFKSQPTKIRRLKDYIQKMSLEVQQAIIDVLISKTLRATKEFKARTIILGGGVAANEELRKQFKNRVKKEIPNSLFLIPDSQFCTDNGAMVGVAGYFHWLRRKIKNGEKIKAKANLRIS